MKKNQTNPAYTSPITKVAAALGAPMGRKTNGYAEPRCKIIRLFQVPINAGGYDRGGAYWGIGKPLYCATDGVFVNYTRAGSRAEAANRLKLTNNELLRPA